MAFLHISMLYVNTSAPFWRGAFWALGIPFMTCAASSRCETFLFNYCLSEFKKNRILFIDRYIFAFS